MGYFLNFFFTGLLAFSRQVPFDLGQAANTMTLQAAMQGRACQMGNRGLQGIQAVI